MFSLKKFTSLLFSNGSKESLIEIPQGQLFIVRPHSPKGYSELIFRDSAASIRRTGQEFQYQLVIQRAYEEGEAELLEAEGSEQDPDDANRHDQDERAFLLDAGLRFRAEVSDADEVVFAWSDLSGDPGDVYEFVCAKSIKPETAASFGLVVSQCQFERKYRIPGDRATEKDLQEFQFTDEGPIPEASPITSPTRSPRLTPARSREHSGRRSHDPTASSDLPPLDPLNQTTPTTTSRSQISSVRDRTPIRPYEQTSTLAPRHLAIAHHEIEILVGEPAELHLFDFQSGTFVMQDARVNAKVSDLGHWKYWLSVAGNNKEWLGVEVASELNPVFNPDYLSFIFNHTASDGNMYSWLLRFKNRDLLDKFQYGLSRALYEHQNEVKWLKASTVDHEYILDSLNDLVLEDEDAREAEARQEDEEAEAQARYQDEVDLDEDHHPPARFGHAEESDSDEDEIVQRDADGNVNSLLAVGAKHDRSFVVRGSKIGVFKHTPDNHLEFSTNISKVQTPGGKLFSPEKVMLHEGDRNMILSNKGDENSLYRMDLEYGKVVDEWKVHDTIPIKSFAPSSKFSQLTDEQTFVGLSDKALYRVDPRLQGQKLVESELKQYATKTAFTAAATTDSGYIAVGSEKGEIRMFDRLGINAKTALPALGDPIKGIDVSADGRWILATTKTYILLIDTKQKSGKNEGKLGFEKSFPADAKPQPRCLRISPEHAATFSYETNNAPLDFTVARFDSGTEVGESSIITATGPFIVTWSLKKILAGKKDPYSIKRYSEEIKADDFRFGSDKNIVVALPNEVGMVAKRALRRPTRESIMATPQKRSSGRQSTRLRKSEVVNSPY